MKKILYVFFINAVIIAIVSYLVLFLVNINSNHVKDNEGKQSLLMGKQAPDFIGTYTS